LEEEKRAQRKRANIMMRDGQMYLKEYLMLEYYDGSNDGPKIRRF
jgi:hypothetical protein